MSRGVSGRSVFNAGLASSLAALTAACSQTADRPQRSIYGDGSRAAINRPIFGEDEYGVSSSPRVAAGSRPVRKGGGTFKLGSPYKVAGRWYVPREEPGYDRVGVASWYGDDFHGRATANGEVFDRTSLTAAHPTLPLPSYAYVTNLANGRTIMVRINDRGPYVKDRMIDLSHAAARALGYEDQGRARVRVQYAGRAPLNGDDRRERQYLASQQWYRGGGGPIVASAAPRGAPVDVPQEFPAGTAGRWSPTAYRAELAGKPLLPVDRAPPQAPQTQAPQAYRTASAEPFVASRADRRDLPPPSGAGLNWVASPQAPPRRLAVRDDYASVGRSAYRDPDQPYDHVGTSGGRLETSSTAASGAPVGQGGRRAFVQLGTFRDRANAERLRSQFGDLGPVEVSSIEGRDGGELFKVRIGPMAMGQAAAAVSQVSARGVAGSTIVTE